MAEIPNSKKPTSPHFQDTPSPISRAEQLKINFAVNLAYGICRLWFSTCRVKILQPELHRQWAMGSQPYIGATWHRGAIFYCYYYGPRHHMVMFSQSADGEYLARFAQKCGMIPVRGSSTRGGQRALVQMIRHLREGRGSCATVLDGPQGPRFVAKMGLLVLAKNTGAPLLPGNWSADRVITLPTVLQFGIFWNLCPDGVDEDIFGFPLVQRRHESPFLTHAGEIQRHSRKRQPGSQPATPSGINCF
jgi:lysophospholipid acyltransferase (LPLAT)-like uncharacterized protein